MIQSPASRFRLSRLALAAPPLAAIAIVLAPGAGAQVPEPALEPHRFEATFESGSVGSWASYPPAQDTAYDPTIWVRPLAREKTAANRSLFREITPHYRRDEVFGVRELLDMYVDASSVLSFRAYVDAINGTEGIRVRLGFADGTDAEVMVDVDETRRWIDARVELAPLLGSTPRKALTAVAFMAVCPDADPRALHRLGLDDVTVTGWRAARWSFDSPGVHRLEELGVFAAAAHLDTADTLQIRARAPIDVTAATITLRRALTGRHSQTIHMEPAGTTIGAARAWSIDLPVIAGIWRATLEASSARGSVRSDLVYLVRRLDAPQGHPRLFMAPGDAPRILARAASGHLATVWEDIQSRARADRERHDPDDFVYNLDAYDRVHWLPTLGGYRDAIGIPARLIRDNAVVHALTGDAEAGEAARRALLAMAAWPTYVHPHILDQGQFTYWPAGLALIDYAIGFDMVHGLLGEAERRTVAAALLENGVLPVAREYVHDNRVSSNTSNWISHVTGGGILSAVAIMGDVPAERIEPHLTGLILKLGELLRRTYGPEGAYGEGYAYSNFTMQTLGEIMPVLERTFGIRFPEKIGRSHRTFVYQLNVAGRRLDDFGDTETHFPEGRPTFTNFAYALGRWRDPYLKWLYDRWPGRTDRDLFFADLDVEARPPDDLPRAALFPEVGTAVFRSGFSSDDFAFTFRAGPFYNHQHFDQGTFFLSDRGEELITEVGRSDYYDDPWYQPLVIQAGGHNTVLLDDDPKSQKAGDLLHDVPAWRDVAAITDFMAWPDGGFVSARLEPLYEDRVDALARSALWVAPRTIVLVDRVVPRRAGSRPGAGARAVNLRFHGLARGDLTTSAAEASIERPGATLRIRSLAPAGAGAWTVRGRPMTLYEFAGQDAATMTARGFLQLDVPLEATPATIVNVMSTDETVLDGLSETRAGDHVAVTLDGDRYAINTSPTGAMTVSGVSTDAVVYAATPARRLVLHATTVREAGRAVLAASAPVSLAIGRDGSIQYSASEPTEVTLHLDDGPSTLSLPRGHGTIQMAGAR